MIASGETAQVVDALERAIIDSKLPPQFSMAGERLLSQLRTAFQITFVGPPSSGKTSLINMMVGEDSLPAISFGCVIDLEYGSVDETIIEYDNGEVLTYKGLFVEPEQTDNVFRVRVRRPNESLRFQSYTEIRLPDRDTSTDALLDFIAQSSTVTVWCSEVFERDEQTLWSAFPDHIKDHGFLALTMADRQIMKGSLDKNLERLDTFVNEEFFDVFPIAVLQALNARKKGSAKQRELWNLSGGSHFFDAIHKKLSLGREEDTDRARMLLQQISEPIEVQAQSGDSSRRSFERNQNRAGRTANSNTTDTLEAALTSLMESAKNMLREADALGAFDCASVLSTCLETVETLTTDIAHSQSGNPDFENLLIDMQESENMLLLFKIEEDEHAALDAVSLLLQLKKEVSRRIPN